MISLSKLLVEGRYDALVTTLARQLLAVVKDSYSSTQSANGEFAGQQVYFKKSEAIPNIDDDSQFKHIYFQEVENDTIPVEFYLTLKVQWIEGLDDYRVGGDAYNDTRKTSNDLPLIEIRFELDPVDYPRILSSIAMDLRDTLRHEIEHVTQSGWNTIDAKYIPSDQAIRTRINTGKLPPWRYFVLPKEIPAMLQGMYFKAKKKRKPFSQVVSDYLNIWTSNGTITDADRDKIISTWKTYLPKLGIRQEL